jgi:hypothetical protein
MKEKLLEAGVVALQGQQLHWQVQWRKWGIGLSQWTERHCCHLSEIAAPDFLKKKGNSSYM